MSLSFRWVGQEDVDRIALTRLRCYSPVARDIEPFRDRLRTDQRGMDGDYLLASLDGQDVGTTTSLQLNMWVRGGRVPCQGVAWVGTIKTHRRGGKGSEKGIASQLMAHTLNRARERGEVVSALMPFRASYYEHFGYGVVESRAEWTIPLAALPTGDFSGFRFMEASDLPLVAACRQRMTQQGQCDIERTDACWAYLQSQWQGGHCVVDQPQPGGPIQSWMYFIQSERNGRKVIEVPDSAHDSIAARTRQLHFLASLRDQYSLAVLTSPVDLPMNWLLKETQVPHRPVEHPASSLSCHTRMQVRILDHVGFLGALNVPPDVKGKLSIAVREVEGSVSRFAAGFEGGKVAATSLASGSTDVECTDRVWAAVACGAMTATTAASLGLLKASSSTALKLLDALSAGPAPFSNEYF